MFFFFSLIKPPVYRPLPNVRLPISQLSHYEYFCCFNKIVVLVASTECLKLKQENGHSLDLNLYTQRIQIKIFLSDMYSLLISLLPFCEARESFRYFTVYTVRHMIYYPIFPYENVHLNR